MRYLIAGGALLFAGVVAAFLLVPRLVDDERLERHLGEAVMAMTGSPLRLDGGIDIKLLPQPLLTVHRPALGGGEDGFTLTADRLDLEVEMLPLLLGRLEVTDARLVRPELQLAADAMAPPRAWVDRPAGEGRRPAWRRLGIVGGKISTARHGLLVQNIDGAFETDAPTSGRHIGVDGQLAATFGGGRLRLDLQLGKVPPGRPIPTHLQLALVNAGVASHLDFRGLTRLAPDLPGLEGRLSLELPSPETLAVPLRAAGGSRALPLLPTAPVSLDAAMAVELAADALPWRLDDATLTIDGQSLTGSLAVTSGAAPVLNLALTAERLVVPEGSLASRLSPFGIAPALPAELSGTVELRAEVVEWQSQTLRQLALDLVLDGAGTAEIVRASAVLPGPGDLSFTGRLTPLGGTGPPRLDGRLMVATQEPAALLDAFTTPPEPVRRSTTLSLETDLTWAPPALTLRDADLRLDALHANGGIAWRAAVDGRQPQLAVRALIDRFALDDLVAHGAPLTTFEPLLDRLGATDLALDLRIERTSLGEARLGGLVLDLAGSDGRVRVERLSLTDLAGSAVTVDGAIDATSGAFDLGVAADLASLPRLLRLFGQEAPPTLALLGPLNLRGRMTGDGAHTAIDASLDADQLQATGHGRLESWRTAPTGRLQLTLEAAEAAALVRQLGGVPVTDPLLQGRLAAELSVTIDQGDAVAIGLEAALGGLGLELDAARGTSTSGSLDRLELRLGPLSLDTSGLLYRLATPPLGLLPGPPSAWIGYWPAQDLDWQWLRQRDAELALRLSFVDPAWPPVEIIGQLRDGILTIPAWRLEGEKGLIEAGMALAARAGGAGADLVIDLAATDLALPAVLEAIGAAPRVAVGALDLEARLLTSGSSMRAMIANLQGSADLVVSGGTLGGAAPEAGGIPVDRLVAGVGIERGVVLPRGDGVTFAGPDGTGRIDGTVDLLAWMLELELALDGHDGAPLVRQRFFGPIGESPAIDPPSPEAGAAKPAGADAGDRLREPEASPAGPTLPVD